VPALRPILTGTVPRRANRTVADPGQ
jgi:hypothetical protein